MSRAPLWAGWDRWRGGPKAGPFADTGSPTPSSAHPHVEILLGGTWVDITEPTNYVRYADRINISRGRSDEQGSQTEASTCTFTVNNRDGRFTPTNPLGEWYGRLKRGTRIRVFRVVADVRYYRFHGEISSLPTKWDVSGNDVYVPITASGIFRRINQGAQPLKSAAYRLLSTTPIGTGDETDGVTVAYWPLEDAAGTTTISSGIGGSSMTIDGAPEFGAYSDYLASAELPTINNARLTGIVPSYNPYQYTSPFTGQPVISTTASASVVSFFVHMPTAAAGERSLAKFYTTGDVTLWDLRVTTAGALRLRAYDSDNTSLLDTGALSSINLDSGDRIWVTLEVGVSLGSAQWQITTASLAGTSDDFEAGSFGSGLTDGPVTTVVVNDGKNLPVDLTIGHLIVVGGGDSGTGGAGTFIGAGNESEPAMDRIDRLLGEEGIAANVTNLNTTSSHFWPFFSNRVSMSTMGTQTRKTLSELLQEATDADGGVLFETRDELGVSYRDLGDLYNQATALALSYPDHELADALNPTYDDQGVRNDITLSRDNGGSFHVEQTTGPMSTAEPPDGIDRYDTSDTVNLAFDYMLEDLAYWRLRLGTVDGARFPQIVLQLAHPAFADIDLLTSVLNTDIGDIVTVADPPAWMPPEDIVLMVQGYSESMDQFLHDITFNCSPGQPYQVGIYDTDRFGALASQVAGEIGPADTTMQVATLGGPLWTTAAGDFPFDISVGGEQMTVTNITGSSSPQTFTVTRSVNGISKVQPNETLVELYDQAVRAWGQEAA